MKRFFAIAIALVCAFTSYADVYDIRDFGAVGDGKTISSDAINAAIEKASLNGGGMIYIPAGEFLCYSIRLKSNIHLYLEQGAKLVAARPQADRGYDAPEPPINKQYQGFGHNHIHNSLIYGEGLSGVTISGYGMIDGSALDSWTEGLPHHGNKGIGMRNCINVTIKDLTFYQCGHFVLHMSAVDNLLLSGLRIDSDRDGIDIICCRNVMISDCLVNTPQDDSIVLKSNYVLGEFRDVENVMITNCHISGYKCGTLLDGTRQKYTDVQDEYRSGGRIKLGTESSGGYKNITVTNCTFDYCGGIMLQSMDGGHLEDVTFSNITMRNGLSSPFFIRLGARMRSPEGTPLGKIRRVLISNVNVYNAVSWTSSTISGVPGGYVEDVTFSNVHIWYHGGADPSYATLTPPEFEKDYPEPWMFGPNPAKGFMIRHARNISFNGVHFHYLNPDERPLFVESDTENTVYINITDNNRPYDK